MERVKSGPLPDRLSVPLLAATLVAAIAWMIFRTFVGVDFTDEMQYYGEIASLVRTGKLFQDDLFVQQLGYVFLVPFFKLHALFFPNLDFLVLAGRGLMLAGYAVTAWLLWRALAGFSLAARLAALALHFAWIPFQILAPSYNTMSHLVLTALAAGWLGRRESAAPGAPWGLALGLGVLGFIHPPAGVVVSAVFAWLLGRREGFAAALRLAGWTVLVAGLILAAIRVWHGPDFVADVQLVVAFSRAHSVAGAITYPTQWPGFASLLIAGLMFLAAHRARAGGRRLLGAGPVLPVLVLLVLTGFTVGRAVWALHWPLSQSPQAVLLLLLLLLALWLGEARGRGHPSGRLLAGVVLAGIGAFGLVWLSEVTLWITGFFAFGAFVILQGGLAVAAPPRDDTFELVVLGLAGGTLFACTSGNGLNNFGVGCAPVIPLLAARLAAGLEGERLRRSYAVLPLVLLPALMLVHGVRHPYREYPGVLGFVPLQGVPAFRGLRAGAEKAQAIAVYRALQGGADLSGRRVLVIGPQPWIYFASGGVPSTPMLFMHFDGIPAVDQMLADQLFARGEPDYIVVTAGVPIQIHGRLQEWIDRGSTLVHLQLPQPFKVRYEQLTGYELGNQMMLFQRLPDRR